MSLLRSYYLSFVDTFSDYPAQATENAKIALRWADENGWGECGTPVGKARANQLAKGEALSEDTIARMAAFERHRQNSQKELGDGCGRLMWLCWGGDEGIEWAQRKLKQIRLKDITCSKCGHSWDTKDGGSNPNTCTTCGTVTYAEVGPKGGIKPSKKAPKSGTKNESPKGEGTAKGDASNTRGAEVPKAVEETLQKKVDEFNDKYKEKLGYGVTIGQLKTVYQRGVGAFNTSHSPKVTSQQQWAYARVNAYLYLVKNGRPQNPKYVNDFDLLPSKHPKSGKK